MQNHLSNVDHVSLKKENLLENLQIFFLFKVINLHLFDNFKFLTELYTYRDIEQNHTIEIMIEHDDHYLSCIPSLIGIAKNFEIEIKFFQSGKGFIYPDLFIEDKELEQGIKKGENITFKGILQTKLTYEECIEHDYMCAKIESPVHSSFRMTKYLFECSSRSKWRICDPGKILLKSFR